jgi:hypothetical protein
MPDSGKDDARFNLEKAIENWRGRMMVGGIKKREVLDELESHLRDDIEQRVRQGLSDEAALAAAVEALGHADALRREFTTVRPSVPKQSAATLCIRVCCSGSAAFVAAVGVWALSQAEVNSTSVLRFAAGLLAALYFLKLPFLYQRLPFMSNPASRESIRFLSILAWPAWVYSVSPADVTLHLLLLAFASIIPAIVLAASFRMDVELSEASLANLDVAAALSLEGAQLEAARLHHDFVGTEHLLLALLREGSVVASVMERRGVTAQAIAVAIEREVIVGQAGPVSQNLPRTPRANRALELAAKEAGAVNRPVTPEYLFLGLLLEGSGVAARVLTRLGLDAEDLRREIRKAL